MPNPDNRKAAKARALASLSLISDAEEAAIHRAIAEDPETLEMSAEVFRRLKPETATPAQRKNAG